MKTKVPNNMFYPEHKQGLIFPFQLSSPCVPYQQCVRKSRILIPKFAQNQLFTNRAEAEKADQARNDEWIDKTANTWTGLAVGSA